MFLEVITRTVRGREALLARNQASIAAQTDGDYTHTLLPDDVGRGIAWAQAQLAGFRPAADYVWLLDDDNECIYPGLVAELKMFLGQPDVIMLRTERDYLGILPKQEWGHAPVEGRVDAACYVVRREAWEQFAHVWTGARYNSDYDFIRALWDGGCRFAWLDIVASRAQRVSYGVPA